MSTDQQLLPPKKGILYFLGNGNTRVNGAYRLLVITVSTLSTVLLSLITWLGMQVWSDVRQARDTSNHLTFVTETQSLELTAISANLGKEADALNQVTDRLSHLEGVVQGQTLPGVH